MEKKNFYERLEEWPLIFSNEPGTFANTTMTTRIPEIAKDVAEQGKHRLSKAAYDMILQLHADMLDNKPIPQPELPFEDTEKWFEQLNKYPGSTWGSAPWWLSEAYFFRLLLHYSEFLTTGHDPFYFTKINELNSPNTWKLLQSTLTTVETLDGDSKKEFEFMVKRDLWGNRADSCFKAVHDLISKDGASLEVHDDYLIVDDICQVCEYLQKRGPSSRVVFINDNCGTELLSDLALANFLLTKGWVTEVNFQLKALPTYVSDATIADVYLTLEYMAKDMTGNVVQGLATRLQEHLQTKRLRLEDHLFYNSFHHYYELPEDLQRKLKSYDLVILKGDANYRRLLGDRLWPATTPAAQAMSYFPQSFVSLRTLKSNPIVGLTSTQEECLEIEDPQWRVNGKRGIIQSVLKE